MVARENLLVHDETVHFRVTCRGAHISRDDQIHVADVDVFFALCANEIGERIAIDMLGHHDLRIVALGHDVRREPDDGIVQLQPAPVFSSSKHWYLLGGQISSNEYQGK